MNTDTLKERARALGLYGLLAHFDQLDPEHHCILARWIEWEEQERAHRSLQRRLQQARIGRFKALADFDWQWLEHCDRQAVEELMGLDFIAQRANAILLGPNGVGKSTIACNITHQAVLHGHTALFITASAMLNDLAAQDGPRALQTRLKRYSQPALLCIDELGYLAYANHHADLLFEIISRRYEQKSTLVTTNRPFSEWNELFPNAACVVSLVDRLVHHCEILSLEGKSYRLKEAREHEQQRKQRRAKPRKSSSQSPPHSS